VLDAQGRLARRVEVDVASHHPTIDPILPELRTALADLAPMAPKIPLLSTVDDTDGVAPAFDADYWVANLRNPVRFSQAVAAAAADHSTFVEVSPHPLLNYAINDTVESMSSANRFIVTSALKRVDDETLFFHAQLAAVGVPPPHADGGLFTDIPPSPWLHSSYWIAKQSPAQGLPDAHPLLGAHVELPSGRDHVWQAHIGTDVMPWLANHEVQGQGVMSAAGFAEMALAAGCEALGLPAEAVQVNDLEVEQTLALDGQTRVTTQIAQSEDGTRVEIHASSAGGNWRRYAVAAIAATPADGPGPLPDLPAEVGTGWSETEIVLPDDAADHRRYCIHPVMLDAALQSLAAVIPADSTGDPAETHYLPASLAKIRVFGRVGRRARCRTQLVSQEQDGAGQLGRVILMDETGTPTAEITGVCMRPIDPRRIALPLAQKIFDTEWVESSTPSGAQPTSETPAGSWLLLADDGADTQALVTEFTTRFSSPTRRVISERLSDESAVQGAVAKAAADNEFPPAGMIVFVGAPPFDGTDPDGALQRAQELIWAISVVARAAVDGHGTPPRLWLVTRNGLAVRDDESGDPAIGALRGLIRNWRFPGEAARVLAGEPDVGATLVDLDGADGLEHLVATLMSELGSPAKDDVIARRAERRYVERLSRAALEAREHEAIVRADGSYIITGGLGGLGMVVVRWLAERGAGRLVLNGRTDPSDDQRRELGDVANGAASRSGKPEIVFVSGDIASAGVAKRLVAAAEETGLPLRGLVHAAGVSGDGIVAALTREGMERVWAPKVAGALRLHAATATRQLDWWVGFSSMASLLGLPGQLAYTTANAWLDALVAWRRASGLPATAIGWGQWSDVGMSRSLTYNMLDPITPDEGVEALESLVGGSLTRVGVGRMRLDRAIAAIPEFRELGYFEIVAGKFDSAVGTSRGPIRSTVDDRDGSHAAAPDWGQLPAADRQCELETRLRAILARELRMQASAVDVDKPFPELGLDSMMAMTVLKEAKRLLGIDLSATMLWNHPAISSLATYLAELLAPRHVPREDDTDLTVDSGSSVLDELFDSVESASAGSESGSFS
jgi:phthiocerol/phenolphthiocerol synthesis type-I polyketide synthase D